MTAPKRRLSSSRRDIRRSHDSLGKSAVGKCPECGESKRSHYICKSCGYYDGTQYKSGTED